MQRSLPGGISFILLGSVALLYLFGLNLVGVIDPDEPRYGAIGVAMARSGDFVAPRLWGSLWFEKPPLLYWMTAIGTDLHLGPEMRMRLPVSLLSLLFLVLSSVLLAREFGWHTASLASALLATSAGWIAFSSFGLTDLPLAVFFSLAVFLAISLCGQDARVPSAVARRMAAIGAALGMAVLAKGLVPLVLVLPGLVFLRHHWRRWPIAMASLLVVAAPWYVVMYLRFGAAFVQEFFIKHHFERLYSASLQHVQPPYYFFPVLLGALFPWTPLLLLLGRKGQQWTPQRRFLASIVTFGFVFFSLSLNKLPGYLLPLLPACCLLIATSTKPGDEWRSIRGFWLPSAVLIGVIPLLGPWVAASLAAGRMTGADYHLSLVLLLPAAVPLILWAALRTRIAWTSLCLCVAIYGIWLKSAAFPVLDQHASPRTLWHEIRPVSAQICDGGANRLWLYGLEYYRGSLFPTCDQGSFRYSLQSRDQRRPKLVRIPQ